MRSRSRIVRCTYLLFFGAAIAWPLHAQPACTNASLNGKYVISGQGEVYGNCLLGVCLSHTTMSTTGYIAADGNGNITSARLFDATNSGVSDTSYTGKYSVTDCDNGTLSITSSDGKQTRAYNIDPDNLDGSNLAHSAAALDTDPGYDEALQLVRTIDPPDCGSGLTLDRISTNGMERGRDNAGNPVSGIVAMDFGAGTLTGTRKESSPQGFTTASITGTYTIHADCTVTLSRTINRITSAGAHVITGGDLAALAAHVFVWQGDTYSSNGFSCSMQDTCLPVPEAVDEIFDLLKRNFDDHYVL